MSVLSIGCLKRTTRVWGGGHYSGEHRREKSCLVYLDLAPERYGTLSPREGGAGSGRALSVRVM